MKFLFSPLKNNSNSDQKQFKQYSSRFFELFSTKEKINLTVATGNHDVGFHDRMIYFDPFLRGRFEKTFNSSLIDFKIINGLNVINVNSMAMNMDSCDLCNYAEYLINKISDELFKKCKLSTEIENYSNVKLCEKERPILLSHFPLFRESDLDCNEPDSNYNLNDKINIKPTISCLNKKSTNFLLKKLKPRLSLNGHSHYGCVRLHSIKLNKNSKKSNENYLLIEEHTLSSFNWRNRPNPGFLFLLANSNEFKLSKCMLPNENYVLLIYFLTILYIIYYLFRIF